MIAPACVSDGNLLPICTMSKVLTPNTRPTLVSGMLKTDERKDFQSKDSSVETDALWFSSENQLKTMIGGWRFPLLVMREWLTSCPHFQDKVKGFQTQSPDCKAVRRRSMHSLPADTEWKGRKKTSSGWFSVANPCCVRVLWPSLEHMQPSHVTTTHLPCD